MIVVVIIGLLAAMAIPAFQKVRETSQTKAITNNLRQLASGADQYFIEYGVTSVAHDKLIGTNKYIKGDGNGNIKQVAGETYGPDPIVQGADIVASGGAPGTVSIAF